MNSNRKTAIIVGVLFIIATGFLFIGGAVYNPILSSSDYLEIAYPNRIIVIIGILLEFIIVLAMPLIAVYLFPILKKHNEALALGYVGFRFFEAVLFVVIESKKLSLINVSRDYLNRGGIDASYFQNIGSSIQSMNDWTFSIYVLIFTVGALMLYSVLYKTKLVPRFISVWGFIAAVIMLAGSALNMIEMFAGISDLVLQLFLVIPIAVNEMVLAVWLIGKGFNLSANTYGFNKADIN
ncbi:MAG: DUF4386 domain-containing protein [Deltaproteobacteria bacterium]|nr:DUF4386 domain-containing protein [Deltaproteobacteria bacterium]